MSDHTDTESVDSAVPSAQFPREGSICAISTSAPRREKEPTSKKRHISELLKYSPDSEGEPEKEDYLDEALQADFKTHEDDTLPTDIVGSRWMRRRLSNLMEKFTHQFKKNVQRTPASIPPMVLNVNKKLWQSSKNNTGRYRPQSLKKHLEIERHVELLKRLGVIRESKSPSFPRASCAKTGRQVVILFGFLLS